MNRRKRQNIELSYAQHSVNNNLTADIKIVDRFRSGRKVQTTEIILKNTTHYMLAHLAQQCIAALKKIEAEAKQSLATARE